jgi:hypothetical protein
MAFQKPKDAGAHDPAGFTPRSSGLASERAREQGWQTNEDERRREPEGKRDINGGTDYDYGAQDFGDLPIDTSPPDRSADSAERPVEPIKSAEPIKIVKSEPEPAKRKKKAA